MITQNKQEWTKLGKIFVAENNFPWMVSHASNPIAEWRGDNIYRVYFSCRDAGKRSSVGYVDIDLTRPQEILGISSTPVISPGEAGFFDDNGISAGSLVHLPDGTRYFYYLGWNLATTVPWRNFIGLAISEPGQDQFKKFGRAPIMDRCEEDPLTLTYPWVLHDSDCWRMWYGSNITWFYGEDGPLHLLKYADSKDGIHWNRTSEPNVIEQKPSDRIVARPTVLKTEDGYRMWYSVRGDRYTIGYAESSDGLSWRRDDECCNLAVATSGWDSECIEYPFVFEHNKTLYMLYNGNGFGATGFGLAVLY